MDDIDDDEEFLCENCHGYSDDMAICQQYGDEVCYECRKRRRTPLDLSAPEQVVRLAKMARKAVAESLQECDWCPICDNHTGGCYCLQDITQILGSADV